MNKLLTFFAKNSVLVSGVMIAILANPFTYVIIGSLTSLARGANKQSVGYDTYDPFIQVMIVTSFIGALLILVSKISSWILAYRKMKSTQRNNL